MYDPEDVVESLFSFWALRECVTVGCVQNRVGCVVACRQVYRMRW